MKWVLTAIVLLVLLLHQDFWLWTDRRLIFGFLPVGLAYHALYSLLAAWTMWLLVEYAWPRDLERAESGPSPRATGARAGGDRRRP